MNCDICSYNSNLICSNCMNQLLLKYRLQQIDADYSTTQYVKEIDGILVNCINHNSYDYIKNGDGDNLTMKLAQQLLNIEIIQLKKSLLKNKDKIDKLAQRNSQLKSRIDEWKTQTNKKKQEIMDRRNKLIKNYETGKLEIMDEIKNVESRQVTRQLNNLKSNLLQELIELNHVIKKDHTYMSFLPIIPINEYINYNFEIINANLLNIANFLTHSCHFTLETLTFPIVFPNESIISKINSKKFKFIEYQPIIRNRNECCPLYLTKNVYELNKYELTFFVKLLSCLILNLVILIQHKINMDISVSNLVNLGDLVWKYISDETIKTTNKESFLKMLWNLQKYKPYITKVDLNLPVDKINEFDNFKPSKTNNPKLLNLDLLSQQLFRNLGSDIYQFRLDNKLTTSGGVDKWEVI